MRITLTNDFHNTEAHLIVKDGRISIRAYNRAMDTLCGSDTCTCGGIRGPQTVGLDPYTDREGTIIGYRVIAERSN